MAEQMMYEAIIDGIAEEMRRDPTVFVIGQAVTEFDDHFNPGISRLAREFGPNRMRPTGITERFEAGAGVGAALAGARPIVDFGTAAFGSLAYDEVFAKAGLWGYEHGRSGNMTIPVVFRMSYGSYGSSGAEHSRSPLASYLHSIGLKVVAPSNPADAKGLVKSAIRDDNPVVFMQPSALLARRGAVPEGDHLVPIGPAAIARGGQDCTVVAVGYQVAMALEAAAVLADDGIEIEVIDLRSLEPLDTALIVESVRRTGRLVETDEDFYRGGVGAEVAFQVQAELFGHLRAPIQRVAALGPSPASPVLNRAVNPSVERILGAIRTACSNRVVAS